MAVLPSYYETLYVTRPDLQAEDLAKIQQKLEDSISANQGEILKADKWAERELAYEIQDHKIGIYYILVFKALPTACAELEKHLRFYNTDILRFMTLSITEEAANKQKASEEKADKKESETQKTDSVEKPKEETTPAPKVETAPAAPPEVEPEAQVSEEAQEADVETEPEKEAAQEEGGTQ